MHLLKRLWNKEGGSLIGVLIALVIVCALFYVAFNKYYQEPHLGEQTENIIVQNDEVIDTTNYGSALESTKKRIYEMEQQQVNRPQEFLDRVLDEQY